MVETTSTAPMFELRGVEKTYSNTIALHNISHTIAAGETTVLIGPSGCGKSTLLRILIGLISPSSGDVLVHGEPIRQSNLEAIRHHMGYVIQEGGLFPHMTARQNVEVMTRYLRWEPSRIQARLNELIELTHLGKDILERYPTELSGGQRQRISLMRALMLDPDVLLLDEPFGALDPMIRASLQKEVRDIIRSLQKTVVMVTHDLGEAALFADSIVLMRKGSIIQTGGIHEFVHQPASGFVSSFIRAQRSPLEEMLNRS